jgi:hypothetical protein
VVACICHPSDGQKLKIRGSQSRLAWAKKQDPISKITREKELEVLLKGQITCLTSTRPEFKPPQTTKSSLNPNPHPFKKKPTSDLNVKYKTKTSRRQYRVLSWLTLCKDFFNKAEKVQL